MLQTRAGSQCIDFRDEQGGVHSVTLPAPVLRLLLDVLTEIGQGHAVTLIPLHAELTTQEAAARHRRSLRHPPKTAEGYLDTLRAQGLTQTVAVLRRWTFAL